MRREGRSRGSAGRDASQGRDGAAEIVVADLTSDEALRAAADECLRRLDGLDVLVHSNGIHLAGALEDATADDLDRLYAANVRAPFLLTKLLLPALRESAGQIVFVNSSTGLEPRPSVGLFSASQHALRAIAEVLRDEVNADGIRVLNVYPGRTATGRQERIFRDEGTRVRARPAPPAGGRRLHRDRGTDGAADCRGDRDPDQTAAKAE